MAFEEGTETLTCHACGTDHAARWSRMPVREWQKIECRKCAAVLVQGNSVRDYYHVSLLKG